MKEEIRKDPRGFGTFFKELRMKSGKTLREFCLENGFDAGNLSKLERGLLPPPQGTEKLEQYAHALGIERASEDWYEFFDLAAAENGMFPEDLRKEANIRRLPVIFRTLRAHKLNDEQLDALAKHLLKD